MDPNFSEYVSGAPPPAYSEQEFDQKVSLATETSVHIPLLDEDGWEQYDPCALEDTGGLPVDSVENSTSNAMNHSGPSYPSISPLQFEKKSQSKPHKNIPYSSVDHHYSNDLRMTVSNDNSNVASDSGSSWRATSQAQEKNISLYPRPYVTGSTDPPYTSIELQPDSLAEEWQLRNQPVLPTHSYPSQPCTSLHNLQAHQQENCRTVSTAANQSSRPHRSLPVTPTLPRKHQARTVERNSAYTGYAPSIKFDASIAYGHTTSMPSNSPFHQPVFPNLDDVHSFYNSAVSAQLNPLRVIQRPTMQSQYQTQTSPQNAQDIRLYERPESIYSVSSSSHSSSFHGSAIANNNRSSYFPGEPR